jgi:hypothetical protein
MFAGGVRGRETTTEATVVKVETREQSGEAHEEGDAPKKRKAFTRDALSRVFKAP